MSSYYCCCKDKASPGSPRPVLISRSQTRGRGGQVSLEVPTLPSESRPLSDLAILRQRFYSQRWWEVGEEGLGILNILPAILLCRNSLIKNEFPQAFTTATNIPPTPFSVLEKSFFLTPNKNYFSWKIEKLPPQRQNFHKIINDANFLQKLLFFLEKNPHYFSRTALSFWWFVRIYNHAMLDTGGQMRDIPTSGWGAASAWAVWRLDWARLGRDQGWSNNSLWPAQLRSRTGREDRRQDSVYPHCLPNKL